MKFGKGSTPGPWGLEPCRCSAGCTSAFVRGPGFSDRGLTSKEDAQLIVKAPLLIEAAGVLAGLVAWADEFPTLARGLIGSQVEVARELLAKLEVE